MASVFISHRGDDTAPALRLAKELRLAGHAVWIDEWTINVGDSIVAKINEGLTGATYVVLCYSSSGVSTPWITREWMSTLARQLSGIDVKILPVMIGGGEAPAILADIKYADLTRDWSDGVAALKAAIR